MSSFNILSTVDTAQYNEWLDVWLSWDMREAFAHPEYAKLFRRECDHAVCAIQKSSRGLIFLPLIIRPLAAEIWAGKDNEYYDVITPYGFGGPYAGGICDMAAFWHDFRQWAAGQKVIASFLRFSPFAADLDNHGMSVEVAGDIIVRSLTEGEETVWHDYEHKVRTNIRRAERSGLRVEIDETGKGLTDFMSVYYQTMRRRMARDMYYFPEAFFDKLVRNLTGQFVFFHAIHQEKVISSLLVLLSKHNMYAYLLGTAGDALKLYPNEMLHHAAIIWGISHGKRCYVLGGGYERDDGIFRFKKSFAPHGVAPFMAGKQILDDVAYAYIVKKRKKYEIDNGERLNSCTDFFPAYRSKWDSAQEGSPGKGRNSGRN